MTITREVSKTVKDAQGKDFVRKATITFDAPENLGDLPALVASFGSVEKLANAAYFGLIAHSKYKANNELMKGDKTSKAFKKMVAALKVVLPEGMSDDAIGQMVLAGNPALADAFKAEPLTPEIQFPVNPATFEIPSISEDVPEETEAVEEKAA